MKSSASVFGPVPSRRLGQSLGVDPIPFKTCNWNCVYCQLGRTFPMSLARAEYTPAEEIVAQTHRALETCTPDFITFIGSGEPTLHARLGWMIRQVRREQGPPVAVVTNGSLLRMPEVRDELLAADVVLPSLDAGSERLYRQINRPHRDLDFPGFLAGMEAFRNKYPGQIWMEVMLIRGLNDHEEALRDLASALARIRPDEVHINVPVRPPDEPWVRPPTPERLERARILLGATVSASSPGVGEEGTFQKLTTPEAVVSIVQRHPMTLSQIQAVLHGRPQDDVRQAVEDLRGSGRVTSVERFGQSFLVVAEARFS